jgi:hypothetical protein
MVGIKHTVADESLCTFCTKYEISLTLKPVQNDFVGILTVCVGIMDDLAIHYPHTSLYMFHHSDPELGESKRVKVICKQNLKD